MRIWLVLAALGGFAAVAGGAFGAHGVNDPKAQEWLKTGALYAFVHVLAVLLLPTLAASGMTGAPRAAPVFLAGVAIFSGSLFAMALGNPFLAMKSGGFVQESTLLTGIIELWKQRLYGLGALVLATCVVIPMFQLAGLTYILVPLKLGFVAPGSIRIFRAIRHLGSWAMMEVFLIGILVALVKLAKMATIVPGVAVFALVFLTIVTIAAMTSLDPPQIWERLDAQR